MRLGRRLLRLAPVRAGTVRHRVRVRCPVRIERDGRVQGVRRAEVVRLCAAVARCPPRLRIAAARERRASQRQGDAVRLGRRLLRPAPVRAGIIDHRVHININNILDRANGKSNLGVKEVLSVFDAIEVKLTVRGRKPVVAARSDTFK